MNVKKTYININKCRATPLPQMSAKAKFGMDNIIPNKPLNFKLVFILIIKIINSAATICTNAFNLNPSSHIFDGFYQF